MAAECRWLGQADRKERCWLCGYGRLEKANAGL